MGNQVYAFGSSNIATNKIAVFDNKTNSWNDLNQELHSSNTSELVVTPFPVSSLDCVPECSCGAANKAERIFGGSEAEVKIISQLSSSFMIIFSLILVLSTVAGSSGLRKT